jgi:hypothetical protein
MRALWLVCVRTHRFAGNHAKFISRTGLELIPAPFLRIERSPVFQVIDLHQQLLAAVTAAWGNEITMSNYTLGLGQSPLSDITWHT